MSQYFTYVTFCIRNKLTACFWHLKVNVKSYKTDTVNITSQIGVANGGDQPLGGWDLIIPHSALCTFLLPVWVSLSLINKIIDINECDPVKLFPNCRFSCWRYNFPYGTLQLICKWIGHSSAFYRKALGKPLLIRQIKTLGMFKAKEKND